jgi:hypothetical protein
MRGRLQEELLQIWERGAPPCCSPPTASTRRFHGRSHRAVQPAAGRITATVTVELPCPRGPETPRFMALAKDLRRMLLPELHGAALA